MIKNYLTLLLIIFSANLLAESKKDLLSAIAYARSPVLAEQEAYASLRERINQQLSYNICSQTKTKNEDLIHCNRLTHFVSEISDLSTFVTLPKKQGLFGIEAQFDKTNKKKILVDKLRNIEKELEQIATRSSFQTKTETTAIWNLLDHYNETRLILEGIYREQLRAPVFLSGLTQSLTDMTIKAVNTWTDLYLEVKNLGSIEDAYIHAPRPINSVEMTEFSETVRRVIETNLSRDFPNKNISVRGLKASSPQQQNCSKAVLGLQVHCASRKNHDNKRNLVLVGQYFERAGNVVIELELKNIAGEILNKTFIQPAKSMYEQLNKNPIAKDVENKLNEVFDANSALHVELKTDRGNRGILLYEKEPLMLKVKANKPGFFYIVGHVIRQDEQYSYLVDFGTNQSAFLAEIKDGETNIWKDLIQFTVEAPVGFEHLQLVFTSGIKPEAINLPSTTYDSKYGYYILNNSAGDVLAGISQTRGLQRNCHSTKRGFTRNCASAVVIEEIKENAAEGSAKVQLENEAVITFTTMKLHDR